MQKWQMFHRQIPFPNSILYMPIQPPASTDISARIVCACIVACAQIVALLKVKTGGQKAKWLLTLYGEKDICGYQLLK